jgi:hypothetical protein
VIRKISLADSSAVEETAEQLDRDALAQSARIIAKAARVDIYGCGASALVAADLKLHRIGVALATDFAQIWANGRRLGARARRPRLWCLDRARGTVGGPCDRGRRPRRIETPARGVDPRFGEPRLWPRLVMTTPDAQARLAAFAPVVGSLAGRDQVAAHVAEAAMHLADSLESAAAPVGGAAVTAVGGLLPHPGVSTAFEDEIRRRGIDLTPRQALRWTAH